MTTIPSTRPAISELTSDYTKTNLNSTISLTLLTTASTPAESEALRAASFISLSDKSEWREFYGILRDYTKDKDTVSATNRIRKEVERYDSNLHKVFKSINYQDVIDRMDLGEEMFKRNYDEIRHAITDQLRPLKCSDPKALYQLVFALFLCYRFKCLAQFIRETNAKGFGKGGNFVNTSYLELWQPLCDLLRRCQWSDKQGNPIYIAITHTELRNYQILTTKKSWQIKHKDLSPQIVCIDDIFDTEEVCRAAWSLETAMMSYETLDKMSEKLSGNDPEYRKVYPTPGIRTCARYYEQTRLCDALLTDSTSNIAQLLYDYFKTLKEKTGNLKQPQPVIALHMEPIIDPKTHRMYVTKGLDGVTKPAMKTSLLGLWNSMSEASRETDIPYKDIHRSVDKVKRKAGGLGAFDKNDTDGHGNCWTTLRFYSTFIYGCLIEAGQTNQANLMADLLPWIKNDFEHMTERTTAAARVNEEMNAREAMRNSNKLRNKAV